MEPVTNNPCVVLPEIINDPLITAGVVLPSYGNDVLEPTPDNAYEAVVANEADVGVNVIDVAADAVVANEELTELLAQLLVPIKFPVNEPLKLPVFICKELETVPDGSLIGANDAAVANDAVAGVNVIEFAALAVTAFDAQLLVPIKFPVTNH